MKPYMIITFALLIVIVGAAVIFADDIRQRTSNDVYAAATLRAEMSFVLEDFATYLTNNNYTMYGAFWCGHCERQREDFGEWVELLNYVECSTLDKKSQVQECRDKNIKGYPTWISSSGDRLEGYVPIEELMDWSGYT